MKRDVDLTPSQTVGPFFHVLTANSSSGRIAGPEAKGRRIQLICRVFDGDGAPVNDALIEVWQANADGKYHHPEDTQEKAVDLAFCGFGRMATAEDGSCCFDTIKPGRVPGNGNTLQAPHLNLSVFARGVLKRLATRVYFAGGPANPEDTVLALTPEDRRGTLLAQPDPKRPGVWRFDIHLCGERETVFFDV
ncbi:MAG: protocatechuate 3,4-dioxygenase subunit alpha [Candidatus Acidiferrales bacterium]